jgi:hypothetical protein
VAAVEAFTARLARSVGTDATEELGWLAGEAGQRLALLLHHLVGMHLPGVVGACQDCRWRPTGACMTWAAIADLLAGRETAAVRREFELLRRRYGYPAHPQRPEVST